MKRLIICCDGTWQVADKAPTTALSNIAKLSRMIHNVSDEGPNAFPQVVYYQSGVGTTSGSFLDYIPNPLSGSFGVGLEDNVLTAYHYLSTNYHHRDKKYSADEIFLFGFSRGAFTARALAGLVTELGLIKPDYLNEFRRVYALYRKVGNMAGERGLGSIKFFDKVKTLANLLREDEYKILCELHEDSKDQERKMYDDVTIKVVGVWDTVGALGIPDSWMSWMFPKINGMFKFHDAALNSKIENAFQALALDEHRGAFKPTLWYLDDKFIGNGKVPNLKQCWFPGFHESIGGGDTSMDHWTKKILPDLSEMHDITLAWMCDQVDGLLNFDRKVCKRILLKEDHDRVNWANGMETDMMNVLLFFNLNVVGGDRPRTPGRYHLQNAQWEARTNETIHPSVYYRVENSKNSLFPYFPPVLREHAGWWPKYTEPHAPRWQWKEGVCTKDGRPDGNGAVWMRPSVPRLWPHMAQPSLTIDEWVIREVDHRVNFEAKLLPPKYKQRLGKRNARLINEAAEHAVSNKQYWTRTTWVGDSKTQEQSKEHDSHKGDLEPAVREKPIDEVHAGARETDARNHQQRHDTIAALKAKHLVKNGGITAAVGDEWMNGGAVQST